MPEPQSREFYLVGRVLLPDGELPRGHVHVVGDRIAAVGRGEPAAKVPVIDAGYACISPGFIDLHVHGGSGADFMDATAAAFATILRTHARHGVTRLAPTTAAAQFDQIQPVLELCRRFMADPPADGARVMGGHFYGPYFAAEAHGCHPRAPIVAPAADGFHRYLDYADCLLTATIAPEVGGAEAAMRAFSRCGVRVNIGHSHATFEQVRRAIDWGARHVDHLFCAMSDRGRLRQTQPYPMRGGVVEAALFFDELTTEVIADSKHLDADLLLLAWKIKGPDRLALVSDCSRALDMPDGDYVFGPALGGTPFVRRDGVGLTPDGRSLASSVSALDHMVRTFHRLTGRPLWETVRMASLTPARIAGLDAQLGSIQPGKRADLLLLDDQLQVRRVFIDGRCIQND